MTIDLTIPRETKSLIRPLQRTFYPTEIPEQHHQLKNFISTTKENIIYYASQHEIYALHISKQKRELIASLPWKPQCLDAGYGWICVGGSDSGRCAFVNTHDECPKGGGDGSIPHHVEVDALLPLELDPESRLLAHNFLQQRNQTFASAASTTSVAPRGKAEVHIHEVGGSIVNSVTIHRLRSDREGFEDEIVAVLTNNDHTVRIFSLTQSRVLDTLRFPTPMNHATISPDGKILLAVGDEPQAFFCGRTRLPSLPNDGEPAYARYEWHGIAEPKLSLAHSSDACFSTAFSPSGHICAVASQTGVITIFDTSMIKIDMEPDDAVLDVLKSSRPCLGRDMCGAVRSMSFAPAPWDLFAWAEDQGRVCVVDLRNAFLSRQTIELETDSPSLSRAVMSDLEDSHSTAEQRVLAIEARFAQRHREALEAQDHLAAVNHAANFMELAAERRRIEREARESQEGGTSTLREELNSLTESERQMLDSTIRMTRIQENEQERADAALQTPFSVNYVPTSGEALADAQLSLASSSTYISPHVPQSGRGAGSIQDYMRQRSLDRSRPGERTYQPRRRSSVVISNGNSTNNSNSAHPSSLAPIGTATPTLSASPSRLASGTEPTVTASTSRETSWQTMMDTIVPGTPNGEGTSRLRRERDTALARPVDRRVQQQQQAIQQAARLERVRNASANMQRLRQLHGMTVERARAVENLWDDHELELRRFQETRGRRDEGLRTMGVGWSDDGRNLYVATEDGILEYTVNIDERKTFPGMTLQ